MVRFAPIGADELATISLDGIAVDQLSGEALNARASALGLPTLGDELQTRLLIGTLSVATNGELHKGTWLEVRSEARGLLLLALRREGCVSPRTVEALTVLNKPPVVEKYRTLGNRWTIPEASRDADSAVERARKELDGGNAVSTSEWLRGLADALEEPADERPWWSSKVVLAVLSLAALFVMAHVALLVRVLFKVHARDTSVLFLPIVGLSASALVGTFAIGIHRMSEPAKKAS